MTADVQAEEDNRERPLRFGILCMRPTLEAWEVRCVEQLLAAPGAELAVILLADAAPPARQWRHLFWRFFVRFWSRPRSSRQADLAALFAAVPRLVLSSVNEESLRRHDLAFILRFGDGPVPGPLHGLARHGIWFFHAGDEEGKRGGPPGVWEIYHGERVTAGSLRRLAEPSGGSIVLRRGFFKTYLYSYARNLDQLRFQGARWPAQVCTDLRNGCADYLNTPVADAPGSPGAGPPANWQMPLLMLRMSLQFLRQFWLSLFVDMEWNVGVVRQPIHRFLEADSQPAIEWLEGPPRGHFSADPFVIASGGKVYLLYEDFVFRSYRGRICGVELKDGQAAGPPQVAFDLPFHLSYPYLFEHEGEIYCLPEMFESGEVSLYRAEELPHRWTRVGTLLEKVPAIDTTVFPHDGRWWLFCCIDEEGVDPNVHLFIWHAPDLKGPWQPHPGNPVKCDVRSARPAGPPFLHNGCLYRPGQDSSRTYGGRVLLLRVDRLTPTEFHEELVAVVEPEPHSRFPSGLHTVCGVGDLTIVDGKRFIYNRHSIRYNLRRQFSKQWRKLKQLARLGGPERERPRVPEETV